jgi:enoyl-CoA hydratase/carnithine racemase
MKDDFETLKLDHHDKHVIVVTLNRPHVANAINSKMMDELAALWTTLVNDVSELRCVVLTGAGKRAFSAGADLKEREGISVEEWRHQHAILERAVLAMQEFSVPIIAAVNGAAYGGGCELALLADFVYAARSARFALPEVTRGIIPGGSGTQNLPRVAGIARAKEIILTGRPFDVEEALSWGVVNRMCEDAQLLDDALATADQIAANAPIAVQQARLAMEATRMDNFRNAYIAEIKAYDVTVETADRTEGIQAFNEKRATRFKGH